MDANQFVPTPGARSGSPGGFLRKPGAAPRTLVPVRADATHGYLQRDLGDDALRQPPEPVFSSGDVAGARRDGWQDGHAAGLAEAAASLAAAQTTALEAIAVTMAAGHAENARVADDAAAELAATLVAALGAVMPDLIRRSALNEASAMLALVLPGLAREPDVRVEVPEAIAPGIEAALIRLSPEHRERIEVASPATIADGGVLVRWKAGLARRQPAEIWRSVMDVLEPALQPSAPNHKTTLQS
jgi:flagellar assembly protein FliH